MSQISDNTPIIIGVGQVSERRDDANYAALSPMDLAGNALATAIADSDPESNSNIAASIDTIAAIRQFEISSEISVAPFGKSNNPPRSIGNRVGANPKRAILEITGGQGPQKLVGELAQDIADGKSAMAAIVGSEAISTMLTHLKSGDKPSWPKPDWNEEVDGDLEDRGYGLEGQFDRALLKNGFTGPVTGYALFDNARRHKLGIGVADYQSEIGQLFAPFTDVAAANPHSASPKSLSFDTIATMSDKNRMISHPYLRHMVSRDQVNQGAAIILSSVRKARELGIAEDKWVYIHGVTCAKEASIMERSDLSACASAVNVAQEAFNIAGQGVDDNAPLTMRDMCYLDLYSCFSFPVFTIMEAFNLSHDDKRGLTLTGGLPFFGGAGNNYSSHAIVEAVIRARRDPKAFALVGANGGAMSKYACGIYSTRPTQWDVERYNLMPDTQGSFEVAEEYDGEAIIESYTIAPNKRGAVGTIIARTAHDKRAAAMINQDASGEMQRLSDDDAIGRSVAITHQGKGVHSFAFD